MKRSALCIVVFSIFVSSIVSTDFGVSAADLTDLQQSCHERISELTKLSLQNLIRLKLSSKQLNGSASVLPLLYGASPLDTPREEIFKRLPPMRPQIQAFLFDDSLRAIKNFQFYLGSLDRESAKSQMLLALNYLILEPHLYPNYLYRPDKVFGYDNWLTMITDPSLKYFSEIHDSELYRKLEWLVLQENLRGELNKKSEYLGMTPLELAQSLSSPSLFITRLRDDSVNSPTK